MDATNNSVVGHVAAFMQGAAFLIPQYRLFSEISAVMFPREPIRLPSPFCMLANLAHHFYSYHDEKSKELARKYAVEALADAVLDLDTSNDVGRLFKSAMKTGQDVHSFAQLLCLAGEDVQKALRSPSTWVASLREENKAELLGLLHRLREVDHISARSLLGNRHEPADSISEIRQQGML